MRHISAVVLLVAILGIVQASDERTLQDAVPIPVPEISVRDMRLEPIPVPVPFSTPSSSAKPETASVLDDDLDELPGESSSAWVDLLDMAHGIAEVANGVFMWSCPRDMLIREGSVCVQVRATRLSAAELLDEYALWEWEAPWQDSGFSIDRQARWFWERERRWVNLRFVIQDGYTIRKPLQPMVMLPIATYDGVLIGVYIDSTE